MLGGASLFGGRGSFIGALLGAALITEITNATTFLQLSQAWQFWFLGLLTLGAAAIYTQARRAGCSCSTRRTVSTTPQRRRSAIYTQPTMADIDARPTANVGQRLRTERERQKIGLRELARRVNLSASLISQIELGRATPSVGTLYAIVTELNLSLDELFFEADERTERRAAPRARSSTSTTRATRRSAP